MVKDKGSHPELITGLFEPLVRDKMADVSINNYTTFNGEVGTNDIRIVGCCMCFTVYGLK